MSDRTKYETAQINLNAAIGYREYLRGLYQETEDGSDSKRLERLLHEQYETFKRYQKEIDAERRAIVKAHNPDEYEKAEQKVRYWKREVAKLGKHARTVVKLASLADSLGLELSELEAWAKQLESIGTVS